MIKGLKQGKVAPGSAEFEVLQAYVQEQVSEIYPVGGVKGLIAKAAARIALNKLNARLSFFGWAIDRKGNLFEVRVRGEDDGAVVEADRPGMLSLRDMEDQVRHYAAGSGFVVDPITGRRVPKEERHRYGMS